MLNQSYPLIALSLVYAPEIKTLHFQLAIDRAHLIRGEEVRSMDD